MVIEGGGLKDPWVPRDIVLRGGIPWIELSKRDNKFQLFVRHRLHNKTKINNIINIITKTVVSLSGLLPSGRVDVDLPRS